MNRSRGMWPSWILALGAVGLLLLLAVLQYRWIGEISEAELARVRSGLREGAAGFARAFDRELTRAFFAFEPEPGVGPGGEEAGVESLLLERWRAWRGSAPYPELVRAVFLARRSSAGGWELARLDAAKPAFEPAAWPPELEPLRALLSAGPSFPPGGPEPRRLPVPLADGVPALLFPLHGPPQFGDWLFHGLAPWSFEVVWLDLEWLRSRWFPELEQRFFPSAEEASRARAWIVEREAPARLIYGVPPGRPEASPDVIVELFRLTPREELSPSGPPAASEARPRSGPPDPRGHWRRVAREMADAGRWELRVGQAAGSLELAVSRARRRNLALSGGILLLLGLSVGLLLRSGRRAQELARRQLEFVAGVTHELLTPLAAVRSAGQNLADGVVREAGHVRRYGALIDREGRRLAEMVGQVLEFAGMQSGRRRLALERVAPGELLESALSESRSALEQALFEVELSVAPGLPELMADRAAVGRALRNLIGNAIKHAAEGRWIRLGVSAVEARGRVELCFAVEDRGPGVAAEDLPHLFEPFYRGRGLSGSRLEGAGLGLSLVRNIAEAHGGRVDVVAPPGRGCCFTLRLPAVPPSEEVA